MLDLVFEGGAIKGLAYLGALEELEKVPHRIRRVVGTSAGAIFALLLAIGYSSAEMREQLDGGLFQSFFDVPQSFDQATRDQSLLWQAFEQIDLPLVPSSVEAKIDRHLFDQLCKVQGFRQLFSLVERGGLFEGKAVVSWLEDLLMQKDLPADLTLKQLTDRTHIELSIVAADTTSKRKLVLNHLTAPQMPAVWAVRASMSIPLVWQEVAWQPSWGPYLGQNMVGHALVDGGITSNFALDLLLRESELGPQPLDGYAFGFLLDESTQVEGIAQQQPAIQLKTVDRLLRTIETMRGAWDNETMYKFPDRVCHLPCKGIGTLEINLDADKQAKLVQAAKLATHEFLSACPLDEFQ